MAATLAKNGKDEQSDMYRLKVNEVAREKGLSLRQLQKRSGLDMRLIHKVMRDDQANITLVTLDRLALACGVDMRDLIESMPEPPSGSPS